MEYIPIKTKSKEYIPIKVNRNAINVQPVSFGTNPFGSTSQSTSQVVAPPDYKMKDVILGLPKATKDVVLGLPKATVDVAKQTFAGFKEMFTKPSAPQKQYEEKFLPYASKSSPVIRAVTAPGVWTGRMISRFINPGLQSLADNLAEIKALNEKGGVIDQINQGKLPPEALNEFAVLQKTASQVVGDVAQAVLSAYAGGQSGKFLKQGFTQPVRAALKTGAATGLEVGTAFGAATAASSGSKNPLEIASIVGTSGAVGSVLGAVLNGTIPVSKRVFNEVKIAKQFYDTLTPQQKQAGFAKNPFDEGQPKITPEEKIGQLETLREILKDNIDNNPVANKKNRLLYDNKEGSVVELGDSKTKKRTQFIEDRMAESGFTDPVEFKEAVETYNQNKLRLKALEDEIKTLKTEMKTKKTEVKVEALEQEAPNYKTANEFAKQVNINGVVPRWGTRNQYHSQNPYKNIIGKSDRWELEQVLKDKPAYLNDGNLKTKELKDFASKNSLVYLEANGREVVAKNQDWAFAVIDARNQRELGLALGYENLGKSSFSKKELTDIWNKANKKTPPPAKQPPQPKPAPRPTDKYVTIKEGIKPPKVTKAAIDRTVKPPAEKVTVGADVLLKEKLKAEVRGTVEGRRVARAELINAFRGKAKDVADVRGAIVTYAKKHLPPDLRGKLLVAVRDAATTGDAIRAFLKVDKIVQQAELKTAISNLKKSVDKALESGQISVDYKNLIKDAVSDIELQGHTENTMKSLEATREYIERAKSVGEDVEIPERILEKLEILDRTPKKDLTIDMVEALQNEVDLLVQLGETKLRTREALYENEKELRQKQLLETASLIDSKKIKQENLTPLKRTEKWINKYFAFRNYLQKTKVGLTPMDGFAEITGMTSMKQALDLGFNGYLTFNDARFPKVEEILTRNKLSPVEIKQVGTYAIAKQKGGKERLIQNNKLTEEQIDSIKLNEGQKELYNFIRKELDAVYPQVKKWARDEFNVDVGQVDDYVSFRSDFDAMNDLQLSERFNSTYDGPVSKKNVKKGFVEERAEMSTNPLELDIVKVFTRHMDDVAYALNMSRDIKMYSEIVKTPEMQEKLGDVGTLAWVEWLDLMARKGGAEGAKRIAVLDTLRKNLTAGVLGYRLSSALVQLTSFSDAMATIGAKYATKGAEHIAFSRQWRNFVMDNFPEIKKAVGDDLAFRELDNNGWYAKATKLGMTPLQFLDGLMRSVSAAGAYEKFAAERGIKVDLANPNKELVQLATAEMRKSQGSSFFKDQPLAITKGMGLSNNLSLNKTLLTFQSFMLHRWDNISRQIWREGIKKGDYVGSLAGVMYFFIIATAMEEGLRRVGDFAVNTISGLFGGDQKERDPLYVEMGRNAIQSFPIGGSVVNSLTYGSNPVPVLNTINQAATGLVSAFSGKEPETRVKGAVRFLGSAGALVGAPGASQFGQFTGQMLPSAETSKRSQVSSEVLKKYGIEVPSRKDILKKYQIDIPTKTQMREKYNGEVSQAEPSKFSSILAAATGAKTAEASTIYQAPRIFKPENYLGQVREESSPVIQPSKIKSVEYPSEKNMPTISVGDKKIPIDKVKLDVKPKLPTKITFTLDGKTQTITDPVQLETAARIKAISDDITPAYSNYLLKLAFLESSLGKSTINKNKDATSTIDRGVFMLNDKAFPIVTDELAHNLDFATLFAISLIEEGRQHKWVANPKARRAKIIINY